MENKFSEYNRIKPEVIEELWNNSIFVFDANVILNLYRYSDNTSKEFIQTISDLKERAWIPFQVGLEFNRNRLSVISGEKNSYSKFESKVNELIGDIENKDRNPFLSDRLVKKLQRIKVEIKDEIDAKIKSYDKSLSLDPLHSQINLVFNNKVGETFSSEELSEINKEGDKRYKNKIPPGYCDIKKPESKRYGDLIIWKQIISKSKSDKKNVIFILDDRKEDWWLEHEGKTISPRPELLKEFRIETQKNIHFYKPFQFLEYSNKYLGKSIENDVIKEVKNYKPSSSQKNDFIEIQLTLKGTLSNLKLLINDLKIAGYKIFSKSNKMDEFHELLIILPNIPDLERRLNSKYISNLANYNLNLLAEGRSQN